MDVPDIITSIIIRRFSLVRCIQDVTNSSVVRDERKSSLIKRKYFEIAHQLS
jgi:hypothetical protein